nr:MAG TPA: hypothetical protein [Caudoviricetes sp.]
MNYVKQNFTSGQTLTADQLNHIEDGIATLESEPKTTVQQIQIIHTALKEAAVQLPAAISFIDDDCRVEAYTVLWPVVQAKNVPYAVACPPAQIGKDKFMTKDQLLNMVNGGCEVLSHHYKEDAMTQFESAADYEADVKKSLAAFTELGVNEVDGVVYPNGYRVDEYMPVVRKYFNVGFTIDRGINVPPVETCYMKRCELFPTNGLYTLDDAKKLVDSVTVNGGWLIFMTHAWYTSFSASDLATLIEYITSKHIDIVGIKEGMEKFGNVVDIGYAKKPLANMSLPYYIVDCLGRVYVNTWNQTAMSKITRVELNLPYHVKYTLTTTGKTKDATDVKRIISDKITAAAGEQYELRNLSAKYGNCFYVIYDASDAVLTHKGTDSNNAGEVMENTIVTMPENTAYFRLACDLAVNDEMFKAYKIVK